MNTPGPSRHANATTQATSSSSLSANVDRMLAGLNPAQLKGSIFLPQPSLFLAHKNLAVEHDPTVPLQILAGPGSGKTKVRGVRDAYSIY